MTVALDGLRDRLRARGEEIAELAAADMVAQMYDAAGPGLPDGTIVQQTVDSGGTSVTVRISVPEEQESLTVWEWKTGEPSFPFHPHQRLDGVAFNEGDWQDVLSNEEGWPGVRFFYPGDHDGCQCTVENLVGDLIFDPEALLAEPLRVTAFGQDILVVPAAPERTGEPPEWWTDTVTPERWRAAVEDSVAATGGGSPVSLGGASRSVAGVGSTGSAAASSGAGSAGSAGSASDSSRRRRRPRRR